MSGELETAAAQLGVPADKLKEHQLRLTANAMASAEALPGPVRTAFDPCQNIQVGPYSVRPCYDADIEYLSLLSHPLNEMRLQAQASGDGNVPNLYQPQGQPAWQLCYLLTTDIDEIDALFEKGGIEAFKKAAKKKMSRLQLSALVKLSEACIEQYGRFWLPVQEYGPAQIDDDSPEPKKNAGSAMGSGS